MRQLIANCACLILLAGCAESLTTEAPTTTFEQSYVDLEESVSKRGASGMVRATAANMEVEILESNSDFINYIYLVSPGPDLLIGADDDTGTTVALPTVMPNQELIFEIRVFDGAVDTGMRWQTGPPARNPDLRRHALVEYRADGSILVSFEDLDASGWGVADEPNFVDAVFEVRRPS